MDAIVGQLLPPERVTRESAAAPGFLWPHQMHSTRETPAAAPAATEHPTPRFLLPHELYSPEEPATVPASVTWFLLPPERPSAPAPTGTADNFGGVPALAEAIASLPSRKVAAGDEVALNDQCAVCQEGYEAGEVVTTLPCAHEFHEGCIVDWLSVSAVCPLCRYKLPTAYEDEDEDEDDDSEYDFDEDKDDEDEEEWQEFLRTKILV